MDHLSVELNHQLNQQVPNCTLYVTLLSVSIYGETICFHIWLGVGYILRCGLPRSGHVTDDLWIATEMVVVCSVPTVVSGKYTSYQYSL